MQNPFETGHIKNYILLYVGVVLIMVLFFIATSLFHDVKEEPKKSFAVEENATKTPHNMQRNKQDENDTLKSKLKLMDKSY